MAVPKQFLTGQHKAMASGEKVTGMKKGGLVGGRVGKATAKNTTKSKFGARTKK